MANPLHDYNTDELRFSHLFGRLEAQIVDIKC
jgi:hypothetical protein